MHYLPFIRVLIWIKLDFTIRKCCGSLLPDFRVSHLDKCWHKDSFYTRRFGISLQQCVKECQNRPKCNIINYRSNLQICELISTTSDLDGNTTVDGTCTIVQKHNIQSKNNCSCAEHEVCNHQMGKCSVEECAPFLITNGNILGNLNAIGSRVTFTCNPGTIATIESVSTCLKNGTWSVYPQCTIEQCPDNFMEHNGSCYSFESERYVSWGTARDHCQKNPGAHLVHINNKEENDWIITRIKDQVYWIGLSDRLEEGQWIWHDTGTKADYTNWHSSQPNNLNNQDCVAYRNSYWYDDSCESGSAKPICELEI